MKILGITRNLPGKEIDQAIILATDAIHTVTRKHEAYYSRLVPENSLSRGVANYCKKEVIRKLAGIKPGPNILQHVNRQTKKPKFRNFVLIKNREHNYSDAGKATPALLATAQRKDATLTVPVAFSQVTFHPLKSALA